MKTETYPYTIVRELGRPRKKSTEIRVDSYNKEKPTIVFIKDNEKAWALTKGKSYQVIKTELISNNDEELCERVQAKLDKKTHRRLIGTGYSHMMPWYFQIVNDKGNKRCYPQTLFELKKGCGKVWFGEDRLEHSCGFDILCEECKLKSKEIKR